MHRVYYRLLFIKYIVAYLTEKWLSRLLCLRRHIVTQSRASDTNAWPALKLYFLVVAHLNSSHRTMGTGVESSVFLPCSEGLMAKEELHLVLWWL